MYGSFFFFSGKCDQGAPALRVNSRLSSLSFPNTLNSWISYVPLSLEVGRIPNPLLFSNIRGVIINVLAQTVWRGIEEGLTAVPPFPPLLSIDFTPLVFFSCRPCWRFPFLLALNKEVFSQYPLLLWLAERLG